MESTPRSKRPKFQPADFAAFQAERDKSGECLNHKKFNRKLGKPSRPNSEKTGTENQLFQAGAKQAAAGKAPRNKKAPAENKRTDEAAGAV